MQEDPSHFQVVDGKVAAGFIVEGCNDVGWPRQAPNNGWQVLVAGDPHATSSVFARIAIANVGWEAWDELFAVGGTLGHLSHDGAAVLKGPVLDGVGVDSDDGVVPGTFEALVEGGDEALLGSQASGGVLEFAEEGFEVLGAHTVGAEDVGDGGGDEVNFGCW